MPCCDQNAGQAQACTEKGPVAASGHWPCNRSRISALLALFLRRSAFFLRRSCRFLWLRSGMTLLRRALASFGSRTRLVLSFRFIRRTRALCASGRLRHMAFRRTWRTPPSRVSLLGPVFRWSILGWMIPRRRSGTRFLRRHSGSMIRRSGGSSGYDTASAEFAGASRSGNWWTAVIRRCEQSAVLAGGMFMLRLRRYRRNVSLVGIGFLFGRRTSRHAALAAVECHVRIVIHDHGAIHVDVADYGRIHIHDSGVVEESPAAPLAAVESVAAVTEAIVNATVEADMRSPVAGIPDVGAVIPTPVAGGP